MSEVGADAELRIIEHWLAAGSSHTLALAYDIGTPTSPKAQPPSWEAGSARLSWNILLSDLNPARYLESWLPSNLLFDNFPVNLEVEITDCRNPPTAIRSKLSITRGSIRRSFRVTFTRPRPLSRTHSW